MNKKVYVVTNKSDNVVVDVFSGPWANRRKDWDVPLHVILMRNVDGSEQRMRLGNLCKLGAAVAGDTDTGLPNSASVIFDNGDVLSWSSLNANDKSIIENISWSNGSFPHSKGEQAAESDDDYTNKVYRLIPQSTPSVGDIYDGVNHIPANNPITYIKLTWSGDGSINGSTYEMTSNGANTATLTLEKWDERSDEEINSGGESYWVCVEGTSIKPNTGKVQLDDTGKGSVSFVPSSSDLGISLVNLMPVDDSYPSTKKEAKLGLV